MLSDLDAPSDQAFCGVAAPNLGLTNDADYDVVELVNKVEKLGVNGTPAMIFELFERWLARHPNDQTRWAACFNYAVLLNDSGHCARALTNFAEAIRLSPAYLPSYVGAGSALERLDRPDEAVALWLQAADYPGPVDGDTIGIKLSALRNVARLSKEKNDVPRVEEALRRCLDIDPKQRDIMQNWIVVRATQCKWPAIESLPGMTRSDLMAAFAPLNVAMQTDDPIYQLAAAFRHCELDVKPAPGLKTVGRWVPSTAPGTRPLRIGYVSPDLREHPVGQLTAELFGLHDRTRVKVFGYYSGPVKPDAAQERMKLTFDHWREITGYSDKQTARLIVGDKIDIVIDLGGHTNAAPLGAFALRPAPIIANWLGYPGSMGSPHHQYIIADATIIPPAYEKYYSEKVVRLPCYQPSNRQRMVGTQRSRAELGLPDSAMVYCCFNGSQKIAPATFGRWMAILARVPNAVLWLLTSDPATDERLRQHAASQGISPDRLIFADRFRNADHLARYRLADLFLDTSPYGAHTTASDALWMGVPILTIAGHGFASRVCASLATAAGLAELVCDNEAAYEELAVHLGTRRDVLLALRDKLGAGRDQCVLFDMPRLVTELETLYEQMWDDYRSDRIPEPDLANLGAYHEVACALDRSVPGFPDLPAYERKYTAELRYRDAISAIPNDRRLWHGRAAMGTRVDRTMPPQPLVGGD